MRSQADDAPQLSDKTMRANQLHEENLGGHQRRACGDGECVAQRQNTLASLSANFSKVYDTLFFFRPLIDIHRAVSNYHGVACQETMSWSSCPLDKCYESADLEDIRKSNEQSFKAIRNTKFWKYFIPEA